MKMRKLNAGQTVFYALLTLASIALWADSYVRDYIGDTRFIGHVSMAALVISCAALTMAAMAAWRSDVPTEVDDD